MQLSFKNLVLAILFLVPLFFVPGNTFIEADKAILFRLLASFGLILSAITLIKNKEIRIPQMDSMLMTGFFGLAFTALFSVIASVSSNTSFWGSFQRPLSFFTLVILVLLTGAIISRFKEDDFNAGFKAITYSSVIVSGYGLLQLIGIDIFGLSQEFFNGRIASFIAHPSFLGQYLLLTIFVTILTFERKIISKNTFYAFLVIQTLALFASGNRASILGLLVGLSAYVLIRSSYNKLGFKIIGLLVAGLIGLQFLPFDNAPVLNRLYLNDRNLASIETRVTLWESSFELIKQKPLIGHGPDVFQFTFSPYIDSTLIGNENINSRPDKAHNFLIQTLHDYGVLGLVFLLLITLWVLRTSYQRKEYALAAMILGYMVSLFFGFQSIADSMIIFFVIGYLLSLNRIDIDMKKFALPVSTAVIVFALFAVAVSGSLFLAQRSFAKSDFENASKYGWMHDDLKQYEVFYSGDVIKLDKVIKRNPLNSDAWYIKAKWAQAEETYADANIFIRNALAIAPNDIKLYELKSRIEFDMGNFEATVSTINKLLNLLPDFWSGSQDGEDYEFRKRIFNKENSSFDVNFIYLSRAYFELDDIDNSLKYLSYAKDSYDKFYTYAVIYELIGESELAKEYEEKSFMFKQ